MSDKVKKGWSQLKIEVTYQVVLLGMDSILKAYSRKVNAIVRNADRYNHEAKVLISHSSAFD